MRKYIKAESHHQATKLTVRSRAKDESESNKTRPSGRQRANSGLLTKPRNDIRERHEQCGEDVQKLKVEFKPALSEIQRGMDNSSNDAISLQRNSGSCLQNSHGMVCDLALKEHVQLGGDTIMWDPNPDFLWQIHCQPRGWNN
jgi:hypothetical protein